MAVAQCETNRLFIICMWKKLVLPLFLDLLFRSLAAVSSLLPPLLAQVVAVSGYGKWKTATQLISIAALLLVRIPS